MSDTDRPTVVGVFEDRRQAERAVEELQRAGFAGDRTGLLAREGPPAADSDLAGYDTNTRAEEGMTAGLLSGGAAGGLLGALAAVLIPGVGLVAAAGAFVGILGGAAVGGVVGTFVGMGIPEAEARMYERELLTGRTLVTVRADGREAEAVALMRGHGAYDASKGTPPAGQTTGLS